MKYLLAAIAVVVSMGAWGQLTPEQERLVDSLKSVAESDAHDTLRIRALEKWDNLVYWFDAETDQMINATIREICETNLEKKLEPNLKRFYQARLAACINVQGIIQKSQGQTKEALNLMKQSLALREELGDPGDIARALGNLGTIYQDLNNFPKAIECQLRALDLMRKTENDDGVARALNNIGVLYKALGDNEQAISYYQKSMALAEKSQDKTNLTNGLNNLGVIYHETGEYEQARSCYDQVLQIAEGRKDAQGIAMSLINLAAIYEELGDIKESRVLEAKSLEYSRAMDHKWFMCISLNNLADLDVEEGMAERALKYSDSALVLARKLNTHEALRDVMEVRSEVMEALGRHDEALAFYKGFIRYKDSLESQENTSKLIRQEFKYAYDKKTAEDSIINAQKEKVITAELDAEKARGAQQKLEAERHELEASKQEQRTYLLALCLLLALLGGGFAYNRFKVTRKQRDIIKTQKQEVDRAYDELDERNREVMDSITYAKRIQTAILPTDEHVQRCLPNSFILYKPKDIVAGDFYWVEQHGDQILFAAADCTGHGVPGALVSVVCHNAMNRAVREFGLTNPGQILDKTREIVIEEFVKGDRGVKDGMDIALVSLGRNQKTEIRTEEGSRYSLLFAGAYNPLWIIRNGECIQTKGDKQPIALQDKNHAFTTHQVELQPGDTIYVFSDGYADQFGGTHLTSGRAKKFKTKAFKELLISIQDQSMPKQRETIDKAFEDWRGDLEQIDDVCVIGVRV